jgi:signal peptidase
MGRLSLPHSVTQALHVLFVLLVVAAVVPFAIYAFPPVVGADNSYVVLSGSMEPAISPGDAVVVASVPAASIAVGDVITFRTPGSDVPVTHRVVDVTEGPDGQRAFVTKGDANEDADLRPVTAQQVVGRVALTVPYVGYVIQFVNSPTGFVALVLVPIGLLLLNEVWTFVSASRGEPDATRSSAAVDPDPAESRAAVDSDLAESDGFSLTRADLTLTSAALGVLAVYAVYVGFTARDALSIAVGVGATTAVVLAVAVRQFGFAAEPVPDAATDGGESSDATARPATGRAPSGGESLVRLVPSAALPADVRERPRVEVGSRAALSALADRVGRPVVRDAETDAHLLLDGDVVYAFADHSGGDADADAAEETTDSTGVTARRDAGDDPEEEPR